MAEAADVEEHATPELHTADSTGEGVLATEAVAEPAGEPSAKRPRGRPKSKSAT